MYDLATPDGFVVDSGSGLYVPGRIKVISVDWFMPTKYGIELVWDELDKAQKKLVDRLFRLPDWGAGLKERIRMMAGSDTNYTSKALGDLVFGKTAYAGETTVYCGLWTAALDDTFAGNTSSEAGYTSYARLALTNNTTIFPTGTGTTTYSKSWPGDAAKNFPTSTGGSSTVTYFGALNGNAGTSADKGIVWASVTSTAIASGDTPQLAQNAVTQTRD